MALTLVQVKLAQDSQLGHTSAMKYETALRHYRKVEVMARTLGVKSQAVYLWKKAGVIPYRRALQIQELTQGQVEIDTSVYAERMGKRGLRGKPSA